MTDETPDATTEEPEGAGAVATEVEPDVAAAPSAEVEPTRAEAEPVRFWQRPNVERYVVPLLIPIFAVLGIVIMVLNISRLLLSAHGHIPVVVGSIITGAILFGASIISNSARLRSSSMTLLTIGFVLLIISGGWLVLGHSQVKNAGGQPLGPGPCQGTITITALPSLKFTPASLSAKTGIYCMVLTGAQGHTLDMDDSSTLFTGVELNAPQTKVTSRAFFGQAGAYTFFCAIPGHRQAGMQGTINVTGPTMTVDQAQTAAGGSSGGATGATGSTG
jgi:plastocyanin